MAAWAVPAALGAVGLIQSNNQANAARHTAEQGVREQRRLDDAKLANLDKIRGIADAYDPAAETASALKTGQEQGSATLEGALRNLSAQYRSEGGVPGLSSEYLAKNVGTANRVLDPLRVWAANQATGGAQRKAQLYSMASGAAPGQVGDEYFRMASMMPQTNPSGSFQSLAQAFQVLMSQKKSGGGAGGTGDNLSLGGGSYDNPLGGPMFGGGSFNMPSGLGG